MNTARTNGWSLEEDSSLSDSLKKDRDLFFHMIQYIRPQVLTSLLSVVFPAYVTSVSDIFKKHVREFPFPTSMTWAERLQSLRKLSELEVRATINTWSGLQSLKSQPIKKLCQQLELWGKQYNLEEDWCYDHAIRTLRSWLFNPNVCWLGQPPSPPEILGSESTLTWSDELNLDLHWRRFFLTDKVYPTGPLPFTFQYREFSFKIRGWDFLQEEAQYFEWFVMRELDKSIYQHEEEMEKRYRAEQGKETSGNTTTRILQEFRGFRTSVRTRARKALASYMKEQVTVRNDSIEKYALVKPPRHYARDRVDELTWLVHYQIPPCKTYKEIAGKYAGVNEQIVRKVIEAAAANLRLPLRNPRLRSGRPLGRKDSVPRRREA